MARRAIFITPGAGKPEQIATVLEQEIRSGALGFGERLQSENAPGQRFAVSRSTVRRGLEELSARGLITTRVGIGSFVTFDGKTVDDAIGWSKALADAGANAETRTLRLEVIEDAELAARLGIDNPAFIAVDRVRSNAGDGHAISIERSRLPLSPELEEVPLKGLREGSLHQTLRGAGLVPDHGEEWADVAMLSTEDAAILGCAPGAPFLRTRRLTRAGRRQADRIRHQPAQSSPFRLASGVLSQSGRSMATDRAIAALIGGALGDALGMPTQLLSPTQITQTYGFVMISEAPSENHPVSKGLPAGAVTDDTEQTLLLGRILLDSGKSFDHRHWVDALVDWERDVKARGSYDLLGPSTKRAIDAINDGMAPEEAGRSGDTNGAAMRIAPVGIMIPLEPLDRLVAKAAKSCRATHNTSIAIASAAAVAAAVSCGISGGHWREARKSP